MDAWTAAWIAWGAAFLVIELAALFATRGRETLSAQVWDYLTRPTDRHPGLVWLARVGLLAGLGVLGSHLAFGIP